MIGRMKRIRVSVRKGHANGFWIMSALETGYSSLMCNFCGSTAFQVNVLSLIILLFVNLPRTYIANVDSGRTIQGAGKSVLLSFIRYALECIFPHGDAVILHFFFKNGDNKTTSPVNMAATLADQLIQVYNTSECVQHLCHARNTSNTEKCTDFSKVWELFMTLIGCCQNKDIYIIIDAVDECDPLERSALLEKLTTTDWRKLRVQIILSSRVEEDIKTALKNINTLQTFNLTTERSKVNSDIVTFVKQQMKTQKCNKLQPFTDDIISTITGTFSRNRGFSLFASSIC